MKLSSEIVQKFIFEERTFIFAIFAHLDALKTMCISVRMPVANLTPGRLHQQSFFLN